MVLDVSRVRFSLSQMWSVPSQSPMLCQRDFGHDPVIIDQGNEKKSARITVIHYETVLYRSEIEVIRAISQISTCE